MSLHLKFAQVLAAGSIALFLSFAPGLARADDYTSPDLGFSANFPAPPTVSAPAGSEKDQDGKFISNLVQVIAAKPGESMAAVFKDSYFVPRPINVAASLTTERDNFLKAISGFVTSSREATVNGHRASYFTFDTPNHTYIGQGVVLIIESEMPQIYFVFTAYTSQADANEQATLDTFFASFKLL